jgi:glycosyltransferase involved in cell wall biosynthesis
MTSRILYVEGNTDGTVGGSYYILLDLVRGLDRARFEPVVMFTHENIVAERLREAGVRVLVVPPAAPFVFRLEWMNKRFSWVKKLVNLYRGFVRTAIRNARFLRRERIDMVNLNNSITTNHPWMAAARLSGTPCISHEMGINQSYSFLSRKLGARLDAIICLSEAILEAMRAGGVGFPNTTVIHSVFDPKRYVHVEDPDDLRRKHGIPAGAPVIGVVGNVKEWKGQETIVRATHLLRHRHPEIRCVLAGGTSLRDRPYLEHLESLCEELDLRPHVIFAGFQKNPIDYMRLMDVVAHTSVAPEPFGIVLLEAMLVAKPLVSTTIGGPAEIVVNGVTGILVEPGQPDKLADAIDALLRDPAAAAEMGRKGRARLEREFALERTIAETTAVYERVLEGRA